MHLGMVLGVLGLYRFRVRAKRKYNGVRGNRSDDWFGARSAAVYLLQVRTGGGLRLFFYLRNESNTKIPRKLIRNAISSLHI